jgi:uncharacterized repeat protein (TIGR03803 family)
MTASLRIIFLSVLMSATTLSAQNTKSFGYSLEYAFTASSGPTEPVGAIQASDGNFYSQLINGNGTQGGVLQVTPAGVATLIHTFCATTPCPDYGGTQGQLIQGSDGLLYGSLSDSTRSSNGVIYSMTLSGTFNPVAVFCKSGASCQNLTAPTNLIEGSDDALYGTNIYGQVIRITKAGVYSFFAALPYVSYYSLLQGSDGNFYGAMRGGAHGQGAIFKVTLAGTVSTIYSFCSVESASICMDGAGPSVVIEGADGALYGTTGTGGSGQQNSFDSELGGTIFRLTTSGTLTTLYNFCSVFDESANCLDGASPYSTPYLGSDGNLYGVTSLGGPSDGQGTAYQLDSGTLYVLADFCPMPSSGCSQSGPVQPQASFVQAEDGSYWSTSTEYGEGSTIYDGVYFKLTDPDGQLSPVQLTPSSNPVNAGASYTLTYKVANATSDTMGRCYAANNAGDTTWSGLIQATASAQTVTLTAPVTPADYIYSLTCGGVESNQIQLDVQSGTTVNTTTALTATPNPATPGNTITLRATVTPASGTTKPSGTITFFYGTLQLGSAALSNGVATFSASSAGLPNGSYAITAKYAGAAGFAASSGTATVVLATATTATLTANPVTVTPPASVTLTATVARKSGSGAPTGTVTFSVGATALATMNLTSGVAKLTAPTSGIAAGKYPVTAHYNGDSNDIASTSNTVTVTVQ